MLVLLRHGAELGDVGIKYVCMMTQSRRVLPATAPPTCRRPNSFLPPSLYADGLVIQLVRTGCEKPVPMLSVASNLPFVTIHERRYPHDMQHLCAVVWEQVQA